MTLNLQPFFLTVSLLGLSPSLALAKEFQCKYEKRFKDGASTGAKVKLRVTGEMINKLVVHSFISSGEVIEIDPIGRGYKINLEGASRESCGLGAEWPEYVVIHPGDSICQVKN